MIEKVYNQKKLYALIKHELQIFFGPSFIYLSSSKLLLVHIIQADKIPSHKRNSTSWPLDFSDTPSKDSNTKDVNSPPEDVAIKKVFLLLDINLLFTEIFFQSGKYFFRLISNDNNLFMFTILFFDSLY